MKIRIIANGIFGADGEIPIGTEFDVKDEPKGWAGRYEVVSTPKKRKAVTNPKKDTSDAV